MIRFLIKHPNFCRRPSMIPSYYRLYRRMQDFNLEKERLALLQPEQNSRARAPNQMLINLKQRILSVVQRGRSMTMEQLNQKSQGFSNAFFQQLSLYYESLQSLVQGRRQILQDEQFKFQDGETVREKAERFEDMLRKIQGKLSPKKQ